MKASVATQWSSHTLHSCDAVLVIARVMNIIVIKIIKNYTFTSVNLKGAQQLNRVTHRLHFASKINK